MLPKNRPPTHPGEVLLEEFLKPLNLFLQLGNNLLPNSIGHNIPYSLSLLVNNDTIQDTRF